MTTEYLSPDTLEDLCRDRGTPINDRAQMEIRKEWISICQEYNIEQCRTEAPMPWQNKAT